MHIYSELNASNIISTKLVQQQQMTREVENAQKKLFWNILWLNRSIGNSWSLIIKYIRANFKKLMIHEQ